MAQLRQSYEEFVKRGTEILAIGPDSANEFVKYWTKEQLPFHGLADPKHVVADRYGQQVKLLKLGRMPALMVVDKAGQIRFTHYSENMRDYPTLEELYAVLDRLQAEDAASTARAA